MPDFARELYPKYQYKMVKGYVCYPENDGFVLVR